MFIKEVEERVPIAHNHVFIWLEESGVETDCLLRKTPPLTLSWDRLFIKKDSTPHSESGQTVYEGRLHPSLWVGTDCLLRKTPPLTLSRSRMVYLRKLSEGKTWTRLHTSLWVVAEWFIKGCCQKRRHGQDCTSHAVLYVAREWNWLEHQACQGSCLNIRDIRLMIILM